MAEWERLAGAVALTPEVACEVTDAWKAWIAVGGRLETGGVSSAVFLPETWGTRPEAKAQMMQRLAVHCDEALRLTGTGATPQTLHLLFEAMREPVQLAYMIVGIQTERNQPPAPASGLPPLEKTTTVASTISLRGLFDASKAVATGKPRVIEETSYMVEMLAMFLGHDDATRLMPDDLRRWRDAMKADGRSNNTWNNRLSMIRQLLAFGVAEGKLAVDPTEGLRLRKSRNKSPVPYTDAEATRILLAARKAKRASIRWALWIACFTGMRAAEVLQLLGRDVRQEGDIWVVDVNEASPDQSVKTSRRCHVPVHEALIREGFMDYAKTIAANNPLFPDKKLDEHGNRGGRAWQVIGRWVRDAVGIMDPTKAPDHSWRHRMEDELRAIETPEDVRDAILGHARKTTRRVYGVRGEALTRLHRYSSQVPVPAGVA